MVLIFDLLVRHRKHIEAALEHNDDAYTFDDVAAGVLAGRFQLWEMPSGCLITEIVTYPRKRVINVFLGGGDLSEIMDMHDKIEDFARSHGCASLTVSGRAGWARVLPKAGWKMTYTTMEKPL